MLRLYLLSLLLLASCAQLAAAQPAAGDLLFRKPERVFTVVEQQPEFPGGFEALQRFIRRKNHYPKAARKAGITGRVFVSFTINTDGTIQDIQSLKTLGFGCDEQAMRLVARMPRWTPGSQDGKLVRVRYNLPIPFGLPTPRPIRVNRRQPPPEMYSCCFSGQEARRENADAVGRALRP